MDPIPPLQISRAADGCGRATLTLAGALDGASSGALHQAVADLVHGGAVSVVIDLDAVATIDCHGLAALLEAGQALGGEVSLRGTDDLLGRALGLAATSLGTGRSVPFHAAPTPRPQVSGSTSASVVARWRQ